MTRPRLTVRGAALVAALAVLLALALGACTSPLDEAGARQAATGYFMTFDHEGDNAPVDVIITDIRQATREGRSGWEVAINGRIVMPGLPDGYISAMVLFVFQESGTITVMGQS